jgi:hypothetical protein
MEIKLVAGKYPNEEKGHNAESEKVLTEIGM